MQHHLIAAPVRLFGNFAGVCLVRKHGNRQRIGEPEQRVSLRAVVSKIVDHDGKSRASWRCGRNFRVLADGVMRWIDCVRRPSIR